MSMRSRGFKSWLRQTAALSLLALLAACGSTGVIPPAKSDNGYLLTVKISSSDTQEAIAQQYGGKVIAWMDDKAILKLSNQAYSALKNSGVSLQATTNGTLNSPEASASGWNAWAGGWNAWAGGWNAWAGGWNAWAGGTSTTLTPPADNDAIWKQINLYTANQSAVNFGKGIKVAVIDTGLDTAHPMFSGRLAPAAEWRDFIDNDNNPQEVSGSGAYGHGTAVAGIIAQVAPKATILPLRVLDPSGKGNLDTIISAINYAINAGAKVINLSLGSYTSYQPLTDVINYAASKKVIIVASAGNDAASTATYPAALIAVASPNFLYSIGSTNSTNVLSSFSNRGGNLLSFAPGEGIVSSYPGSQLVKATGTSFAAPLFSGALALALSDIGNSDPFSLNFYLDNTGYWSATLSGYSNCGALNVNGLVRGARQLQTENLMGMPYMENFYWWTWKQNASITSAGYKFAGGQISGQGGIGQVVTGLWPNTAYTFGGWVRVDNSSYPASLRVKNYGGVETSVSSSSTTWTWKTLTFTTGATNTSAEIYLWKNGATGNAFGDEFMLSRK